MFKIMCLSTEISRSQLKIALRSMSHTVDAQSVAELRNGGTKNVTNPATSMLDIPGFGVSLPIVRQELRLLRTDINSSHALAITHLVAHCF